VLVEGIVLETGAALVQPPKSSSADTVGAGLGAALGAPQPLPMSFGVRVSGTFIMDAVEGAAATGEGARSGVLHALPPHGSRLPDIMLAAAAFAALVAGALGGAGGCIGGAEILNADFISCWGDVAVDFGGETVDVDAGGGEESPNKSFERDDDGGLGLAVGDVNPPNPKSCPFEDTEVVRDWGFGADMVGEAKLSKRSPPADPKGDVTFGAAGVDLAPPNDARLENAEGFSTGLGGGGEVVVGKLSPLKASVRPPI